MRKGGSKARAWDGWSKGEATRPLLCSMRKLCGASHQKEASRHHRGTHTMCTPHPWPLLSPFAGQLH